MADLSPPAPVASGAVLCRQALDRQPVGQPGAARLVAPPEGFVLQVLAAPGSEGPVPPAIAALGADRPHAVRRVGPGNWLVVGPQRLPAAAVRSIAESLTGLAHVCDQSHGRVPLLIEGPQAATVLNRGAGLDLSVQAFPVGASAQTLFGGIGLTLTRTAPERFELLVLRSYAGSLWDELALLVAAV